jgi:hypothetical protein
VNHYHFFPGLMIFVWLLSACQSPQSHLAEGDFSSAPVFCDGRVAWSAEVTTDDVMGYTTFWIALDAATAQDIFKYIHVDVILDGEPLSYEMKYMQAAEPYSVTCTDSGQQFEASRVKYTLFLPPLSSEEHFILWKYSVPADLTDGVFHSPSGMTADYKIELNLIS